MNLQPMRLGALVCGLGLAGAAIVVQAPNVVELKACWLIAVGIFVGAEVATRWRWAAPLCCGVLIITVFATVTGRRLPIYSLGWRNTDRIAITPLVGSWTLSITNPDDLRAFERFGATGHYETMQKANTNYHIYVWHESVGTGYYIHGDAVGDEPGGVVQTIFMPNQAGLSAFLDGLATKYRDK